MVNEMKEKGKMKEGKEMKEEKKEKMKEKETKNQINGKVTSTCTIDPKKASGFSKDEKPWFYSEKVREHFFHPRNLITSDKEIDEFKADGIGLVGSPACGDAMKMFIKVAKDKDGNEMIKDIKYQTFGCATAIASTSMFSEMVKGKAVDEALKIKPKDIADALGGLPAIKFHCSVLADQAFHAAVKDYREKQKK